MKFALSPSAAKAVLRQFDYVRRDFELKSRDVELPSSERAVAPSAWHTFTENFAKQLADCAFSDEIDEFELFTSGLTQTSDTAVALVLRESLKRSLGHDEDVPRLARRVLQQALSMLEDAMGIDVVERLAGLA